MVNVVLLTAGLLDCSQKTLHQVVIRTFLWRILCLASNSSSAISARMLASRIDAAEPLNHVATMTGILHSETAQSKIRTILLAGLVALALFMAYVGVYGAIGPKA
jgi:hypothetical protein